MYENMKTGNVIVDMVLSTIVVSTITLFVSKIRNITKSDSYHDLLKCCISRDKNEIEVEGYYTVQNWNGKTKTDFPVVMDALFWYIGTQKYVNIIKQIKLHIPSFTSFTEKYDENENEKSDEKKSLKRKLIFRPQNGCFFNIDDINFYVSESKLENDKTTRENILFHLRVACSSNKVNIHNIKGWLENVQKKYENYQKYELDKQKKIFTMIKKENEIEWYEENFISGKNWSNLFCTNKNMIKNKLDFFINNREWYKKRGIPWTFGILTHGPPGCGKTSLEKVFLNYLDRHGVQLNIDENTTYKDIREVFYEPYINGKYIPLNNRVYIIPDIDAMGKVLLKRSKSITPSRRESPGSNYKSCGQTNKMEIHNEDTRHITESNADNLTHLNELEMKNQILVNENKMLQSKLSNSQNTSKSSINDHSLQVLSPETKTNILENSVWDLMKKKSGNITLSQILNLLDGIVELDGRVLIACTNHIDRLDPALIRPGRIDCVVELGLCSHDMIKDILENFYEKKVSKKNIEKIEEFKYSPCRVYEICFRNTTNIKRALALLQETDYLSDDQFTIE